MKKYQLKSEITSSKFEDSLILLNEDKGDFIELKNTSLEIYNSLQNKKSLKEIVSWLMEEYEISENQCSKEILEFLEILEKNNLLEIENV